MTTPPLSAGAVSVRVTNPDGKFAVIPAAFTALAVSDRSADINHDGRVDVLDGAIAASCLGQSPVPDTICWDADLDYDGVITKADVDRIRAQFAAAGLPTPDTTIWVENDDPAIASTTDPSGGRSIFFGTKDENGLPRSISQIWYEPPGGGAHLLRLDPAGRPIAVVGPTGSRLTADWRPDGTGGLLAHSAAGEVSVQEPFTYPLPPQATFLQPAPNVEANTVFRGAILVTCGGQPLPNAKVSMYRALGILYLRPCRTANTSTPR